MRRFSPSILVLIGLGISGLIHAIQQPMPEIELVLPPDVGSQNVQIRYFIRGPFGGYGSFVKTEPGRNRYRINASVDGKPASEVRGIVYMPGCEIVTFRTSLPTAAIEQQLACKSLATVLLKGKVSPAEITQEKPSQVEVAYLADWSHQFFGITDGMVTTVVLGTAVPDSSGQFEISIPDFAKQSELGDGRLQFVLREVATGNIIAFLSPEGSKDTILKIASSYPPVIQLTAERR